MCKENLDAAEKFLTVTSEKDKNYVTVKRNFETIKFMKENKINDRENYLLRKPDEEYLENLVEDDYDKYSETVNDCNKDRINIFRTYLIRDTEFAPIEKHDIFFHARFFLNSINENDWMRYSFTIEYQLSNSNLKK